MFRCAGSIVETWKDEAYVPIPLTSNYFGVYSTWVTTNDVTILDPITVILLGYNLVSHGKD